MKDTVRRRPSHSTVIAYVALCVALSGTAVAASGKIGSNKIKKGGVKTKNLAKGAVKTKKLKDKAVDTSKLAKQAVTQGKLGTESVGTAKLRTNAVTQQKLARDSVGSAQLLTDAVGANKLKNGSVTGDKVPDGSLGLAKIAQLVADVSFDVGSLGGGECETTFVLEVPGLQSTAYMVVLPGVGGWNENFILQGYFPAGGDNVGVEVCNADSGPHDPDPLPLRVLGFA